MARKAGALDQPMQTQTVFFDRRAFAKASGLTQATINKLLANGLIKKRTDGRRIIIDASEMAKLPKALDQLERCQHG